MLVLLSLTVGITVGVLSGLIGVGGGVVLVPALVYVFHMQQHKAQGTSLATLLLPIGVLAFWEYYRTGNVDVRTALWLGLGFICGGYIGAIWAQHVSGAMLRRLFACLLMVVAIKMLVEK